MYRIILILFLLSCNQKNTEDIKPEPKSSEVLLAEKKGIELLDRKTILKEFQKTRKEIIEVLKKEKKFSAIDIYIDHSFEFKDCHPNRKKGIKKNEFDKNFNQLDEYIPALINMLTNGWQSVSDRNNIPKVIIIQHKNAWQGKAPFIYFLFIDGKWKIDAIHFAVYDY